MSTATRQYTGRAGNKSAADYKQALPERQRTPDHHLRRHGLRGRRFAQTSATRSPKSSWRSGTSDVHASEVEEPRTHDESEGAYISKTGCHGFCQMGPSPSDRAYGLASTRKSRSPTCRRSFQSSTHLSAANVVDRLLYRRPQERQLPLARATPDIPFYNQPDPRGSREHCRPHRRRVHPRIHRASAVTAPLAKALFEMKPEEVVETISESGLRGRGGGGFPTGQQVEPGARVRRSR